MAFCRVMHAMTYSGKAGEDVVEFCREADLEADEE